MNPFPRILCIGLCVIASMSFVNAMETPAEVTGLKRNFEDAGLSSASSATDLDGAPLRKMAATLEAENSIPSRPDSPLMRLFLEKTRSCLLHGNKMDIYKFIDMLIAVLQRWYTSHEPLSSDCVVISLRDFIGQLLLNQAWRGRADTSLFVAIQALFYIKEILKKPVVVERYRFGPRNVRCLFFTAFVLAYDFLEDEALRVNSKHWARLLNIVCGKKVYTVEKIQVKKLEFLQLLDWHLYVSPEKTMEFLNEVFGEDPGSTVVDSSGLQLS